VQARAPSVYSHTEQSAFRDAPALPEHSQSDQVSQAVDAARALALFPQVQGRKGWEGRVRVCRGVSAGRGEGGSPNTTSVASARVRSSRGSQEHLAEASTAESPLKPRRRVL